MTIPCSECKTECVSELMGTYLLVFLGPASVVAAPIIGLQLSSEALAFIAFVFGVTVGTVILLLGKRSGAHINPAITLASLFSGRFERRLLIPYIAFQVAGGLLAGLSLRVALGSLSSAAALGSTRLAAGVSPVEGTLLEAAGTFVLAISVLTASSFVRTPRRQAALVGTTLFVLILFIGPLTGASFNPARSLGPSVFSAYYLNQPVYWIGPLLGAGCAGLIFRTVRRTSHARRPPALRVCRERGAEPDGGGLRQAARV